METVLRMHHVNECPATQAMASHYRAQLALSSLEPVEEILPCIHDFGYHQADQCPLRVDATTTLLNAITGVCSHCWLGDDQFGSFAIHPEGAGGSSFVGDRCRSAHGRDFIRDAIYALYHAHPEYVAHHMGDSHKWNLLRKDDSHGYVSYAGVELTPLEMPSLGDVSCWAKQRWEQTLAVSSGVILLLHYLRFTDGGTLVSMRNDDHTYWQTLCKLAQLPKGS